MEVTVTLPSPPAGAVVVVVGFVGVEGVVASTGAGGVMSVGGFVAGEVVSAGKFVAGRVVSVGGVVPTGCMICSSAAI